MNIYTKKILVVGDSILDKYYYGEVERISPEAPIPINHVLKIKNKLGGAANVANNLQKLNCQVSIMTHIGNDKNGIDLLKEFNGIKVIPFYSNQPTTTKIRIIGNNQQMLRLDFEEQLQIENENMIINQIKENIRDKDAVIISDYDKGFCTRNICQSIIKSNKLVIIDPKGEDWSKYKNASYITPNIKELSDACLLKIKNEDKNIEINAIKIINKLNLQGLLVTRSEKGLSIISKNKVDHLLAKEKEVRDVTGCGDTALAVFTMAKANGINDKEAAHLANLAAGITVTKVGTYCPLLSEVLGE